MEPNEETPGVDVAEDPTPADLGTGADDAPDNTGTEIDGADDQPPAGEQPAGDKAPARAKNFHDLFGEAKQKVTAAASESDDTGADGGETKEEAQPEKESDETIPDEKGDKAKAADDAAKADTEGEDGKKSDRTRNYKAVVEENAALKAERDTAVEKVSKLDAKLKEHGGVETVTEAMEIFDKLANGKAAEVIQELPAHQRNAVQKSIFESAITQPANRVLGVNTVLKSDFGLESDLSQGQMEKIFEYMAHKLNTEPHEFEAMIERELEFANTPEKELARLRAENERLKTQPKPDANAEANAEAPESDSDMQLRVQKTHDDFETETFTRFFDTEVKTYGLEPLATDTPAMKEAKAELLAFIREGVGVRMRQSRAYEPLLTFWIGKDTGNPYYKQAVRTYETAMKANVQQSLRKISKLFATGKARTPNEAKDPVPAPGGRGSNIQPAPKKSGGNSGGGIHSAFTKARKSAGT